MALLNPSKNTGDNDSEWKKNISFVRKKMEPQTNPQLSRQM